MEEMLKEMMGNAYKEEMTKDDITAFFKKQVLATGDYTNTGKATAEKKELSDKIAELQAELETKMTEDDKKKKQDADTKKMIEDLQRQLSESRASQSKMSALSLLAEAKLKAGIKEDDTDFSDFVGSIAFEDSEKTNKISKYVSKMVLDAYEAGKTDAIKNKLGKMGTFNTETGDSDVEEGAFGKQLAQSTKRENKNAKNFFERK